MHKTMNDFKLDKICKLLEEKYHHIGQNAAERLRYWLSGEVPYANPEILRKHLEEEHIPLLFDAFWQVLPFGTGGRRGLVGYGANRINPATIAMTVQGHCDYLRAAFPKRKDIAVVIANDVRIFNDLAGTYRFLGEQHPLLGLSSRSLGRLACEIYAGNEITVYFSQPKSEDAVMSTPGLSFFIGKLGAVGGINLSASHNPPDDNGIKLYDEYGSQPIAPNDQHLMDSMSQAGEINRLSYEEALEHGKIRDVPDELYGDYVETYVKLYDNVYNPNSSLPIVYTPLCGCGLTSAGMVLERLGFPFEAPPDQGADGTFSAIPFRSPNPEVPQATEPARAFADKIGSGLVLSSDPDADRIGLEIKLKDGSWYHFDGNQIAAVLCYFLMLDPHGPKRRGLVIETLVTTKLLGRIVARAGESHLIDDLLVGFKYVADVLKTLDQRGRYKTFSGSSQQLVLAAEESHGVLVFPGIRDKDSTPGCIYLAALYQRLHLEGRDILDYYIQILEELGGYTEINRSIMMVGAEGVSRRDQIMASLRERPPTTLGNQSVQKVVDYWDTKVFGPFVSKSDEFPRNVIQYFLDTFVITVRPSGTEPKLKLYCQLLPGENPTAARGMKLLQDLKKEADQMARFVYNDLLARINISLGEAALLLPDIIDLDRRCVFERVTAPRLRDSFTRGAFNDLDDLLGWLRSDVSAMTPGADPLPALKDSIAFLCAQWEKEFASTPLFRQLQNWAMT
jgi:phosphoglucomutase/phosphomannomutase